MKPYRKGKIHAREWNRLQEIRFNYHKYIWKRFKRKINTKRLT